MLTIYLGHYKECLNIHCRFIKQTFMNMDTNFQKPHIENMKKQSPNLNFCGALLPAPLHQHFNLCQPNSPTQSAFCFMRLTCDVGPHTHPKTPQNARTDMTPKMPPNLRNICFQKLKIDMGCGLALTQGVLTRIVFKGGLWVTSLRYTFKSILSMTGSRTSRDQDNLNDKDRVTHRRQGLIDRQTERKHTHTHTNTHTHTHIHAHNQTKKTNIFIQTRTDTVRHNQTNRDREHTILKTQQTHGHTRTHTHTHNQPTPSWPRRQTPKWLVCNGILEGHPLTSIRHTHRHISTANPAPQICTNTFQTKQQTKHPIADVKVAWLLKRIPLSGPTKFRQCWLLCTGQAAALKQHTHQPNKTFYQSAMPRLIPAMFEPPCETWKCTNRSKLCTHDGLQGFVYNRWRGCVHHSLSPNANNIPKLDMGKHNHAQIRSALKNRSDLKIVQILNIRVLDPQGRT